MNYCQFRNDVIKRMANAGGGGLLPRQYQQVSYIENTGEQWINTGVNVTDVLQTTIEIELSNPSYANTFFIFGGAYFIGPQAQTSYSVAIPSSTMLRVPVGGSGFINSNVSNIGSGTHAITYRFGAVKCDGYTTSTESGAYNSSYNITLGLFTRNVVGDTRRYAKGLRVYRAGLGTQANATEYQDLIPCYRKSDNKPGMYDLVTNTFFTNAGTGADFTVGNNV